MEDLVDIQLAADTDIELPDDEKIKGWVMAVFTALEQKPLALTVRVVGEKEMTALNLRYRNQDRSTNVLSFPFEQPPGTSMELLGDIVVCGVVVDREAVLQQKPLLAHWAHIIVHGVLHLYGYNHQQDHAATTTMETLEISILEKLGFRDPYQTEPIGRPSQHAKK